jgi:hypothetical protein
MAGVDMDRHVVLHIAALTDDDLLPSPTTIAAESPRRTALYQTLASASSDTSPMRRAPSATNALPAIDGARSGRARTDAPGAMLMRREYPLFGVITRE